MNRWALTGLPVVRSQREDLVQEAAIDPDSLQGLETFLSYFLAQSRIRIWIRALSRPTRVLCGPQPGASRGASLNSGERSVGAPGG